MKSILILGKGFVGSSLFNYFNNAGVNSELYSKSMMDYSNPDIFNEFLKSNSNKYEAIINASGYTGTPNVDGCEANKRECWHHNVINTINVVKVSNDNSLPVLHIGSGCVYSGYDKEYTEEDEPNFGLYSDVSSFYSKCKHASEILLDNTWCYIFRVRMCFSDTLIPKNYLTKILKYDNLIDENNSITSLTDFNNFIFRFLYFIRDLPGGIYNTVNKNPIKASKVVELLRNNGLENKNWKFIETKDLNTKANRSNCVLSTQKIDSFNLSFPDSLESIERDIKRLKANTN